MGSSLSLVEEAYASAFREYLANGDESALRAAYELGREAVRKQLSMLELAALHHRVLASALRRRTGAAETEQATRAAAEFFLESMSAFEMVQRGFWEATEMALLEKQHNDQLRELATASLALNSSLSVQGILEVLIDRSRQLAGARCSSARIRTGDRQTLEAEATSCSGDHPHRQELTARLSGREGRTLGVVRLFDKAEGDFSDRDESLLAQLGHTAAVAIENAQLYERERQIGLTLQHRLLPGQLPQIPRVTVEARYIPGGVGVLVGGDWYDVIPLPNGRVGIAVGDVLGRGASAASVMGQVRTGFRAYALQGESPETVVRRLDHLIQAMDLGHFSTMVYLVLDPDTGRLSMVRAGHPPPVLLETSGGPRFLEGEGGLALGVRTDAQYESLTGQMSPGSILCLYTDGLVESRVGLHRGLARLERFLADAMAGSADLATVCDQLLDRMVGPSPEDDVAVLMVRLEPEATPGG